MSVAKASREVTLGFLTVVEHGADGLFGGYLVLNGLGRPLEFHCTEPVRPSRAQEILYGPTLRPFLFGEQIGGALVNRSKRPVAAVLTDQEPVLALRTAVDCPMALVLAGPQRPETNVGDPAVGPSAASPGRCRFDPAHGAPAGLALFTLGTHRLAVLGGSSEDRHLITERLGDWAHSFDLAEPFQRIREAIEEARQGGS
ncbi:MAG TPA: hypothetical protein EYP56_10470 [Planctomycetaceae bacterium]|nr:hypothetical protein [Planctomycetaceae bacterium]HIQ21511.1 hypothetical protein [Planctomycetota bacterium]